MQMSEAIEELHKQLFYYDWYAKKVDKNPILWNSIVAYVNYFNMEVYKTVPDKIGDFQVRIHFIGSYTAKADYFKTPPPATKDTFYKLVEEIEKDGPLPSVLAASFDEDDVVGFTEVDVPEEVWQLSKLCGWETLEDIFYEVHDGPNAVSNKSKDFPAVRSKMEELYALVGFDVLADEIC